MRLLPRIPTSELKLPSGLSLGGLSSRLPRELSLGRRTDTQMVGLDIQPGFVAAVQAHVNGSILAERVATAELPVDALRDGEVADEEALIQALRELFAGSGLAKRVRVGVANQRTVLRTLEVPPVTDPKELAAAVNFQAQDQVPMPLNNAVLDFHPLGIVDTPSGPRQRVVLVAAQRDMIERLLSAVQRAGLNPGGIDLSAFALIRSLHRPDPEQTERVLYLNVDGLTNLAIAEGKICRFTRVVGGGLEAMASELAARRSIALSEARALITASDLTAPPAAEASTPASEPRQQPGEPEEEHAAGAEASPALSAEELEASERTMSYEELAGVESDPHELDAELGVEPVSNADVVSILEGGIRDISGEVRNSLDFHRSQDGGGEVSHVVMSGAAQGIPGFAEALQQSLGVDVRTRDVGFARGELAASVPAHRLAVATGLAVAEAPE